MDPKVNGQLQREWGWLIAVYLFLGGVGAGAYTIAAINSFIGEGMGGATTVGLWIGFPALLVGTIFLIADLGAPTRAVLAGMKPGSSWIARGTWIISVFMVLSLLHLVLHRFTNVGDSDGGKTAINIIAVAGIATALRQTQAVRVLVANLVSERGEASGMSLADHVRVIEKHAGAPVVALVFGTADSGSTSHIIERVEQEDLDLAKLYTVHYRDEGGLNELSFFYIPIDSVIRFRNQRSLAWRRDSVPAENGP